jgi:hypothetical protein
MILDRDVSGWIVFVEVHPELAVAMITGTRRMIPSLSGSIENNPRPAAACSIGGTLRKVTR